MRLNEDIDILEKIEKMKDTLLHRGPDIGNVFVNPQRTVALGHRRLSILDLSNSGSQPMTSVSGDLIIVFNGEIYNYQEIRAQLLKEFGELEFRGTSDTEILLNALEHWGTKKALEKCSGMFAIALWSNKSQTLTLCRDRFGEKPLFYYISNNCLFFSSELSGIETCFDGQLKIDLESLALYFRYTYVPSSNCIYEGVKKLKPGHFIVFSAHNLRELEYTSYWNSNNRFLNSCNNLFQGSFDDAKVVLSKKLESTVSNMMYADVPVGAFLSGGVDSAAIVSKMYKLSNRKIQTFSMGFNNIDYDERKDARRIASHFETDHHEFCIDESAIIELTSNLSRIYDEPFSDSSQIPTVLISRFARQVVKVVLTGDGGDEFLGGYPRHAQFISGYRVTHQIPRGLRTLLGKALGFGLKSVSLKYEFRPSLSPGIRKFEKLYSLLLRDFNAYSDWGTHWRISDGLINTAFNCCNPLHPELNDLITAAGIEKSLMYMDSQNYLIDDILVKVDRGSMTNSLETRAPFLEHNLVEFCWSLPTNFLINGSLRKILLRNIVEDEIQPLKLKKQKSGFSIPLGNWLRRGLKEWALEILDYKPLNGSILNEKIIKKVWDQHQEGVNDNSSLIWSVLMFKNWARLKKI